jgi:hypothetical protein
MRHVVTDHVTDYSECFLWFYANNFGDLVDVSVRHFVRL